MATFITLTTDFGLRDGYVAAIKGVISSINPEAKIVDICHTIQPENIREAAFVFSTAYIYFPPDTIHLVIIDPGVGSNRRSVILKTSQAYFVGPDNGVFSYVIDASSPQPVPDSKRVKPGPEMQVYAITKSKYWREPVSKTFHGRDIFAPVAAKLSLGLNPSDLGERVDNVIAFPIPHPEWTGNVIKGNILHIDNFGNLITNIRENNLSRFGGSVTVTVSDCKIEGLVHTYADREGPIALFGSSGYLEISLPNDNIATFLKAMVEDQVIVELQRNSKVI